MPGNRFKLISYTTLVLVLAFSGLCYADYDYIDINSPSMRKIPLAVPLFKSLASNRSELRVSEEASALLTETLDFTGYFKMLDRKAFLSDPQKDGITTQSINFQNWTVIGSELLITGGVLMKGDTIQMELRLFDTFKGALIVGKRYKGGSIHQRKMIRRFCSEVIYHLTGNKGFFNSKIAFVSTSSKTKEIYTCEFDGYGSKRFTHANSISFFPSWSSDGNWLAYTSYKKGKPDIYIQHLTENKVYEINEKGMNIAPAWAPNTDELAATLSFSGDQEIYLLTGKGKIIKKLTNSKGTDVSPAWSPDGKKMAFVSDRAGSPQIFIKDFRTGRVKRLTFQGNYNTQPSWSPKGDKIAYTGRNGHMNISIIGVDGNDLVQLTQNSGNN
ncbi:MAG: DPP IV N-terminal domain-containing protein [Desulfobacterales bacterium]|nr:DPP IV N-terminal domain-containing protein [Desulfobacterales bacterium]